jgi:hypothetical protein
MRRGEREGLKGDSGGGILLHEMVLFPDRDTRGGGVGATETEEGDA